MRPQDTKFVSTLIERFTAPKPVQLASVWAEENLIFDEPKIKGPFTLSGREYLRETVDCAGPLPPHLAGGTDFVDCLGTGSGKTVSLIARLCYRISNDPMRALVVKPTRNGAAGAANFAKTRLIKAIRATRCIRDIIPKGGQSRFDISINSIMLNGSIIDLTGSNSVSQLGENRCDVVEQDEIDKYPPQTEESREANPVILADERTKSVTESRRFKQSTPTLDNAGIWQEYKKTDQRRYFVPCPHCNKKAFENQSKVLKNTSIATLQNMKGWMVFAWSKRFTVFEIKGYESFIKWDEKSKNKDGSWNLIEVIKSAHFICPHCSGKILNSHKYEMNRAADLHPDGGWRPTVSTGVPGHYGRHLPSMYSISRDCDFGQMAKKFLVAKRSPEGVKGFINSDLAEPDVNQSISVDRVGPASKHIEITGEWLKILSVDYQQHAPYFWAMVRAWNGSDKSHGIEYKALNQWSEIDDFQAAHKIIPQAVIIDVGFNQGEVLQNCASLQIPTRCTLDEAVQDSLPMVNGWQPCKSFGNKMQFRDVETGLYRPYKINANFDPYSGTSLAKTMRIELLEFKSDLFEDMMDNVRQGKTFFEWTVSPEVDTEEYNKHMAGKIRKPKKNNPRDYSWAQRHTSYPDHLHTAELMNFAHAYRLQQISFEAIQSKEKDKK